MTFPPAQPGPYSQVWPPPQPVPGQGWGPAPGGYPPPPPAGPAPGKRSNRLIMIAVAILIVVVVIVAALVLFGGFGEKTKTVGDSALADALLTEEEAGKVLHVGALVGNPDDGDGRVQSALTTRDPGDTCSIGTPGTERDHKGSGSTAVRLQYLQSPDDSRDGPSAYFDQAVVAFPDADAAQQFIQKTKMKFEQCAGKIVESTDVDGSTDQWRNGDISDSDGALSSSTDELDDPGGWMCRYAVASRHNAVAEIQLCADNADAATLGQLLSEITDKIDKAARS
ncbi:sensor domain-containing protein [Mycobacterium sp. 48b]|uniref:sensor domain-containing protein n=1 Tax=Mycobacterium sp. 48b TaxID=3400426 RepID=UPI003AB0638B